MVRPNVFKFIISVVENVSFDALKQITEIKIGFFRYAKILKEFIRQMKTYNLKRFSVLLEMMVYKRSYFGLIFVYFYLQKVFFSCVRKTSKRRREGRGPNVRTRSKSEAPKR